MDQAVTAIAKLIGLEDLRPGRHILRDDRRWRTGELTVSYVWHAMVLPSFHDRAVVAVVRASDTEFRGETIPGFLRAGIAIAGLETSALKQSVVVDIDNDPLPSAIADVDLRANRDSLWLDGIGYELHTDFGVCRSSLFFSNPSVPCFRSIEDSVFSVGDQVAKASSDSTVSDFVTMWRGYIADSGRTT